MAHRHPEETVLPVIIWFAVASAYWGVCMRLQVGQASVASAAADFGHIFSQYQPAVVNFGTKAVACPGKID